jgi:hypothetical protein
MRNGADWAGLGFQVALYAFIEDECVDGRTSLAEFDLV